jgi:hypothetical protein
MTDTTNRAADEDYFDDEDIVEVEDTFDDDDDIVDLEAEDTSLSVPASDPVPVQISQRGPDGEESVYTIDLATPPLNREEALELTERIKDTTNALYILIKRAHAGRAYAALGYSTFEEYVKREFDISRSYAYRLLTQANVIEAIESVVPADATFSLNVSQANALKPVLPEMLAELQERTADLPGDEASALITQVVEEQREKEASMRAEAAEEDYQGGTEYSGDYDPEYARRNQDEEEDDAYDAQAEADSRSSAEVAAQTQRRYQALYAVYAALTNISSSKDFDELLEVIPPQRYNEFSELFELAIDRLQEYRTTFAEWVEAHPAPTADVSFDDDEDDDDDFEDFDNED